MVIAHALIKSEVVVLQSAAKFLYLFHMPLFFMLSGMVYKPDAFHALFRKRVYSLLVPYAVFLCLLGIKPLIDAHGSVTYAAKMLYGGSFLMAWVGVFWFVTCLFLTQLLYNALITHTRGGGALNPLSQTVVGSMCACLAVSYALTFLPFRVKLPFAAELVPMAIIFFWVGHVSRVQGLLDSPRAMPLALLVSSLVVTLFLSGYQDILAFDMKGFIFGIPLISVVFAVALVFVALKTVIWLSHFRQLANILTELGQASLVIMYVHQSINLTLQEQYHWPAALTIITAVSLPYLLYRLLRLTSVSRFLFLGLVPRTTNE